MGPVSWIALGWWCTARLCSANGKITEIDFISLFLQWALLHSGFPCLGDPVALGADSSFAPSSGQFEITSRYVWHGNLPLKSAGGNMLDIK